MVSDQLSRIPYIILTTNEDNSKDWRALSVAVFLNKPINRDDKLILIKKYLRDAENFN